MELGLYLLETVMPTRTAADTWTLFGGYPYGEAFGDVRTDAQRLRIRRARHYLWDMRRRREWQLALASYQQVPQHLRGYEVADLDAPPQRLRPARAADRFTRYEDLLTTPPAWERKLLPIAGEGEYQFQVRDQRHSVRFPAALVAGPAVQPHDLDALPPQRGAAVTVTWPELEAAAHTMDLIEAAAPDSGS